MEYLRPGIMASSLLLRPWNEKQAQEVLRELVQCLVKERGGTSGQSYVIESREGTISIPYDNIYFFEAREKKIFVCTGKEEFGFYNTIDKLQEELPEQFIRCHRAFIVNSEKIRKIMLSRNIIFLSDDFDVPLSRSYKAVLKQFGK
jgi:DNA-binding LytR/AlgR family response regulator